MNRKTYKGKHAAPAPTGRRPANGAYGGRARRGKGGKSLLLLLCTVLLLGTVGGTAAYLFTDTGDVSNVFIPGKVEGTITESFDGAVKSSVAVTNTGNVPAYARITFTNYMTDTEGNPTAVTPPVIAFKPGEGWVQSGSYYYCTSPIAPGDSSDNLLGSSITLASGQVVEVLAEFIQAEGVTSSGTSFPGMAWGVQVASDGTLSVG